MTNIRFLRQVAERGHKMILSTGMATLSEIENTMNELAKVNFDNIILMHCTSIYPSKIEQTNLNFINVLKSAFGFPVGFSDHTATSHAALMALTFGATWFEKHFTFDKTLNGLDHKHALNEEELKQYVEDLSNGVKAITLNKAKVSEDENYTKKRARRGLYAANSIKKGAIIQDKDILAVRPMNEIDAKDIDLVIGSTALVDIDQYQPISWKTLNIHRG